MTRRGDRAGLPEEIAPLLDAVGSPAGPPEKVVRRRLDALVKPPGSLGRLEDLAVRLARISGDPPPRFRSRRLFLLVADHGVAARGVSAYPASVTAHMCRVFSEGGAAAQALGPACGVEVMPVDVGVDRDVGSLSGIVHAKLRRGSRDLSAGAALTPEETSAALSLGASLVRRSSAEEPTLVLTGEMGIANTTSASAITAALTGADPSSVVGPGTGVSGERLERKRRAVRRALERLPSGPSPFRVLQELGGLEVAGLVGVVLGAAGRSTPVVLDGFISTAAGAVAAALAPPVAAHLFASHLSPEPGHRVLLSGLGLEPVLDLGLRLGEGTGAILASPIIDAAGGMLRSMQDLPSARRPL